MAQYKPSTITDVYWAANDGFKSGRDPMGIQNSSVATYGCLLPGMTNLTGHIRYYSLYCWLLSEYDRIEKREGNSLHQYNFIRRAELILAFVMRGKDVRSVIGANFVQRKSGTITDGNKYHIAAGADYENKEKYWAYTSGAFGQYYIGAMIHYELVKIEHERFYLRNKGKELAEAVRQSIPHDAADLMLRCICEGRLSVADIENLHPFDLLLIEKDSSEWNILNELLVKQDKDGSTLRRDTVYLMLKDFKNGFDISEFVEHRFHSYPQSDSSEAAFGWYFYYLCEALHYGIETLFCYVLNRIDDLHNPPLYILLEESVQRVLENMEMEQLYDSVEEWMRDEQVAICEHLHKVKKLTRSQNYAEAAAESLKLFLSLNKEYLSHKDAIMDFEKRHDLVRQRGILSEGLHDYVANSLHLTLQDYIRKLIRQVMNEHTFVAISKMGKSEVDLRKFILDNDRAFLVEQRYPNATNPRIESLHNFLIDLGYLTNDNCLTPLAEEYLSVYGKE